MERKPKPVDRDEFERAHKGIKSSRYAEIKEGGKVRIVAVIRFVAPPVECLPCISIVAPEYRVVAVVFLGMLSPL